MKTEPALRAAREMRPRTNLPFGTRPFPGTAMCKMAAPQQRLRRFLRIGGSERGLSIQWSSIKKSRQLAVCRAEPEKIYADCEHDGIWQPAGDDRRDVPAFSKCAEEEHQYQIAEKDEDA